jgi:cobalt-zinc-cadmium efflux system protein
MGEGHGHSHTGGANEGRLRLALALTGTVLVAEVAGGIIAGSLALLSDAAHMLTDVVALVIALIAVRVGRRPADVHRTFGYARFEVLAAALNASLLFLVALYILYEAYRRFTEPPEVQTGLMLGVAVLGLIVNLISLRILQAGSDKSLNLRGAYLEVLADALGSVGVILAAAVIALTGWAWVDPLLAVLIGLWVLPRTWTLLSESLHVLIEGTPKGVDLLKLEAELEAIPGVREVHDLHAWAVTSGQSNLTAHLVSDGTRDGRNLLAGAHAVAHRYGIDHTTFQVDDAADVEGEHGTHARWGGPSR